MKNLNITFTDEEFKRLRKAKENYKCGIFSWHKFILSKCCNGISVKRNGNKI